MNTIKLNRKMDIGVGKNTKYLFGRLLHSILQMGKGSGGGRNGRNNGHIRSGKNYSGGGSYIKPKNPKIIPASPTKKRKGKGSNS